MFLPIRLLNSSSLPKDFLFPVEFFDMCKNADIDSEEEWWFIGGNDHSNPDFWLQTLAKQYPKRILIPFAKNNFNGGVLCFEINRSPFGVRISMIQSYTNEGYEMMAYWPDLLSCINDLMPSLLNRSL